MGRRVQRSVECRGDLNPGLSLAILVGKSRKSPENSGIPPLTPPLQIAQPYSALLVILQGIS